MEEKKIGEVIKFFGKISVAAIRLSEGSLKVGDQIHIVGHTTDVSQTVDSMQLENKKVQEAGPGADIGIKVKDVPWLPQALPVCLDCLRSGEDSLKPIIEEAHHRSRSPFGLIDHPPREETGILCPICVNRCRISEGGWGYCGLRT